MPLYVYNTLTHQKEIFKPINEDHIGLYVCGPTVYDLAHIGNARPVIVFDVFVRVLHRLYPKVTYVRNITDVDDKINAASAASGEAIASITERTTKAYHDDMVALGALSPDIEPRATHHIKEMIAMIEMLIAKGHAYEAEGHVLFSVSSDPLYGHLSRRNREELIAGARVEIAPYKKDPADFVLWKPSDAETPGWDCPWGKGRGRPGWHIECSAMATKYLGMSFDIHGGGIDLTFPHHENEIAQSCCANGPGTFAKYWMHNGHLTVNGQKMSKSLGNFFTVRQLLADYPGEALRYMLMMTHYRQPLDMTTELLQQSKQTLDRFYGALRQCNSLENVPVDDRVMEALLDDLNMPLALTHLHDLVSQLYKATDQKVKNRLGGVIKSSGALLGILQQNPEVWFQHAIGEISADEIDCLIDKRREARSHKDFAEGDRIRQHLLDKGVVLEDSSQGTTWRRA